MIFLILFVCSALSKIRDQRNIRCTNANIRVGDAVEDIKQVASLVKSEIHCGKYFQVVNGGIFCVSKGSRCRQKMDSETVVYTLGSSHAEGGEYKHYSFHAPDSQTGDFGSSAGADTGLAPEFRPPGPSNPGPSFEWANAFYPNHEFEPAMSDTSYNTESAPQYPEFVPNYFRGYQHLSGEDRVSFDQEHANWESAGHGHESEEQAEGEMQPPSSSKGKHPLEPWSFNGVSGYTQHGPFGGYGPVKPDFRLGKSLPKDKCNGRCSHGQLCIARTCVDGPKEMCGEGIHCQAGEFCTDDKCQKVMDFRERRLFNKY